MRPPSSSPQLRGVALDGGVGRRAEPPPAVCVVGQAKAAQDVVTDDGRQLIHLAALAKRGDQLLDDLLREGGAELLHAPSTHGRSHPRRRPRRSGACGGLRSPARARQEMR